MKFTIGGEEYEFERDQVERKMKRKDPELIQKHFVELLGTIYPPKQVFAEITGRRRISFTTQEAVRIFTKLGFVCREVGQKTENTIAQIPFLSNEPANSVTSAIDIRLLAIESVISTAHLAIAELKRRVETLEASRTS